jgi:sigma-B regulation protein RsbU (phosphoserine phosphatase)
MRTTGTGIGKSATTSGELLKLVVIEGSESRTVVLDRFPFYIGRLANRDLVINDGRVSREHVKLTRDPDGVYVVNQSAKHGTWVNGERVERRKLTPNDQIGFGIADGPRLLFCPERSSSEVQQLLSLLSTRKQSTPGSDLGVLNLFLEAARKLNAAQVLDDVLHTLLEASLRLTHAERGFVFLRQDDGELRLAAGRDERGQEIDDVSTISQSALHDALKSASEFLVTDTDDIAKIANRESVKAYNLRNVICIPLRKTVLRDEGQPDVPRPEGADVRGVLYLDSHVLSGKLSKVHRGILHTIADEAATLLENAVLVQSEETAKRARQELKIAADIQRRLRPDTVCDLPYARINAVSFPCKDIGGDFVDLVHTEDGLSLVVADVAGKGVPAAVVGSILQGMLYSHLALDLSLPKMIGAVNRFLYDRVGAPTYATLVVARLQNDGEVELMNCGHVCPLLISGDRVTRLEHGNLPVGLTAGMNFRATHLQMKPGDRLLVVTDGVTEAENAQGEFFGNDCLEACCGQGVEAIVRAVDDFRGSTPLSDDCTIAEMLYQG